MPISASLVKRLRDDTDAPMMECKKALESAQDEGISDDDMLISRAKELLREAGKTAAVKRADRTVSSGTVAIAASGDSIVAVSLLCETDFVARNEEFIALAQSLAEAFAENDPGSEPEKAVVEGKPVSLHLQDAVGKIRENIQLGEVVRISSNGAVGGYLHHDKAKAALVALSGGDSDLAKKVGTQIVALSPEYIAREQIDQARLNAEIELERRKAIEAGKSEEMAQKIAEGRVGKEFVSHVVLLEQPWYADLGKKTSEVLGSAKVLEFARVEAGKEVTRSKA